MKRTMHQLPLCLSLLMAHNFMLAEVISVSQEQDFENITANNPAVVKFSAVWCGACVAAKAGFEELSQEPEFKNIKFLEVDVDANEPITTKFNVRSMPTFIYLENGVQKGETIIGSKGKEAMREELRKNFSAALANQTEDKTKQSITMEVDATGQAAPAKEATNAPTSGGIWQSIKDTASNAWNKITGIFK